MLSKFTATEGQTVYDLAINLYTDLDNVINLLQLSKIESVNENDLNQKMLIYNTDLVSDKIMYNHIFGKRKRFNTGKNLSGLIEIFLLGTEGDDYLTTEDGYKLQI